RRSSGCRRTGTGPSASPGFEWSAWLVVPQIVFVEWGPLLLLFLALALLFLQPAPLLLLLAPGLLLALALVLFLLLEARFLLGLALVLLLPLLEARLLS